MSDFFSLLAPRTDVGDCWVWTGNINQRWGYGRYAQEGAHRWVWRNLIGPIDPDKELDHLCRNRLCVNPDHLEPVTHQENCLRGASHKRLRCKRGHLEWRIEPDGARHCHTCRMERLHAQ